MHRSVFLIPFHSKRNLNSLGEMADSRLGARRMQDELEYIGVPEDRKVLKKTDWESVDSMRQSLQSEQILVPQPIPSEWGSAAEGHRLKPSYVCVLISS